MRAADILTLEVRMKTDKAKRKTDELVDHQKRAAQRIKANAAAMRSAFTAIGVSVAAVTAGVVVLNKVFNQMARVTEVTRAFDTLVGRLDATSDTMLNALKPASRGLISDFELMRQTNNALILGLPLTVDQMAEFTSGAVKLGRALGVTAEFSLESLITGMGRQSRLMLDNIGIMVRQDEAYRKYASEIGKAVDQLTKMERTQAFVNEVQFKMKRALEGLEEPIGTAAESWQRLTTEVINAKNAFLGFLDEALGPAMNVAMDNQIRKLKALTTVFENLGFAWQGSFGPGADLSPLDGVATTGGFGPPPGQEDRRTPAMRAEEAAAQYNLAATLSAASAHVGYGTGGTSPVGGEGLPFPDTGVSDFFDTMPNIDEVLVEPMTRVYDALTLANQGLGEMGQFFREELGIGEVTEQFIDLGYNIEEAARNFDLVGSAMDLALDTMLRFASGQRLTAKSVLNAVAVQTVAIAGGIAIESILMAMKETSAGTASMAIRDYEGAAHHFASAVQYKATAAKAGAVAAGGMVLGALTASGGGGAGGGGGGSTGTGLGPAGGLSSISGPTQRPQEIHIFIEGQGFIQNTTEFARELSDEINRQNSAGGLS